MGLLNQLATESNNKGKQIGAATQAKQYYTENKRFVSINSIIIQIVQRNRMGCNPHSCAKERRNIHVEEGSKLMNNRVIYFNYF